MIFRILAVGLVASSAWAQGSADDLKRCLADIGGVAWRLPYSPRMYVSSCMSPAAGYKPRSGAPAGIREISLAAPLEVGPDEQQLSGAERSVAVQSAALTHFDALFRGHGYARVDTFSAHPGSPYVSYRYTRPGAASLVWKIQSDNTWLVVVEPQP